MTVGRAEVTRGPTSLAETARLSGEFADRHNLVYCVLWLTGELDIAAVREAWRGVCLSHDVLRRAYVSPDEACTYDDVLGDVEFHTADTDTEALKTIRRIIEPPFDLAGVGLSRIAIVQRDDHRHLLGIALDHIIVDEKTWKRLMKDFGEFYERAIQGASVPDKAGKNAYHDFALLERRELSGAWGEERRAFWRSQTEQFGTFPPPFPIACEAKGKSRLTAVHHALPADAKARVLDIARRARATPFVTVASAVLGGLREVSGAPTVGVTTPFHGRVLPGTSDIAGLFVKMVPLSLTARSRRQLETVREVFAHTLDVFEYNLALGPAGKLWNEELASVDRPAGVNVTLDKRTVSFEDSLLVGTKAEIVPLYVPGEVTWPRTVQFRWELDGTDPQIVVYYNENYFPDEAIESLIQAAESFVLSADS
ncbi:thioester reductase [Streptomyces ferrugineus]|uniref:Thioester reductase n=1 Tax=Streptomyces ferrugineus TaxID=1413221 RepID=A0A7M2SJW4_9ACTN|nr:condensation domain-containing protein [Streptomyces ferrugineus]QOV36562.1 thioester reductase [Streptomyces ferrugineus]